MDFMPQRPSGAAHPLGEIVRQNVFTPYLERILLLATAVGLAVVLPLAVHYALEGRVAVAALLGVLVAALVIDAAAVLRHRRPPIPYAILLAGAAVVVAMAIATLGLYASIWAFPTVAFAFFAFPRRWANIAAALFVAVCGVLIFAYQDPRIAWRFVVALALVVAAFNMLLDALAAMHAQLLEHSVIDFPTGAYNRRHMETCTQQVIERHRRTGAPATVLALDLDRFAKVNDRLGVEGGDRMLHAFAGLVRSRVRAHDLLFRVGGQQFLVLLPDTGSVEALAVAEELRARVEAAMLVEASPVTVSGGVAELRGDDTPQTWLRRANQALRHAKDEGRNRVACM